MFSLVGAQHWDPATVRWTQEAEMTLGLVCVYLVVDLDLTDGPNTNYFVFPATRPMASTRHLTRENSREPRRSRTWPWLRERTRATPISAPRDTPTFRS
ncbi:MAG: hypothetical protein M5U19_02005 [Microthrixaceae bacterium]|nr:hypothetical protein [Microthrixaceae bacterium]